MAAESSLLSRSGRQASRQTGFTLVEILIAATILFIVVGLVAEVYRAANLSGSKASRGADVTLVTPLLMDTIQARLREAKSDEPQQQQGVLLGFRFEWQAKVIQKGGSAPRFSPENEAPASGPDRFYLWQVDLRLDAGNYQRSFQFTELSWR
ncbi:PilW family protein [Rheinheimera sp.]|uniref:PilW family protein n=1 Tax=Rheinheimera sp. TaxID=1869214 RepID=UPI0027B89004|nr:prepilin-type N-terminal cleavage/methylation domain-containing protein [Rheinheimera sp.]